MKMCQPHWEELREAVKAEGVYEFVGSSGKQAVRQMADQVDRGQNTIANYDPLMAAHNMIWARSMEVAGVVIMFDNEDGSERCPLCYLRAEAPNHNVDAAVFDDWIPGASRAAAQELRRLLAEATPRE